METAYIGKNNLPYNKVFELPMRDGNKRGKGFRNPSASTREYFYDFGTS